jgi:ferredoxin
VANIAYLINNFIFIKKNKFPTHIYTFVKTFIMDVTLKITDRNGKTHNVQAPTDMNMNIMEVVRMYELAEEGTIGICGGMAMCASCQCYVLNDIIIPEKSDDEDAMLWEAFNVKENSRLGCQIQITPEINGLELELAPE